MKSSIRCRSCDGGERWEGKKMKILNIRAFWSTYKNKVLGKLKVYLSVKREGKSTCRCNIFRVIKQCLVTQFWSFCFYFVIF